MKIRTIVTGAVCCAMLSCSAHAAVLWATPSGQPIYIDGVKTEMSVYCIGDNNYLRLREVAQAVDFDVQYDAAKGQVNVIPATPYSGEAVQPVPQVTVQATVSDQPVYIGGARADLTAYQIGGSNYVKLRDISAAVGFGVSFDDATQSVYIVTKDGTGQTAPETKPEETPLISKAKDYAAEANPAVFSDKLPREFYNSLRHAYLNRDAMAAAYDSVNYKVDESLALQFALTGDATYMRDVCMVMSGVGFNYEMINWQKSNVPFVYVTPRKDEAAYTANGIQDVINNALSMSTDHEKVIYLNNEICDRFSYSLDNTSWESAWNGKGKAKCQQYAEAFDFLAQKAGLMTFPVSGPNHLWNMVYADGVWGDVDCTFNDTADDIQARSTVLLTTKHPTMPYDAPELYNFLKEVYVPGSTK